MISSGWLISVLALNKVIKRRYVSDYVFWLTFWIIFVIGISSGWLIREDKSFKSDEFKSSF